MIVYLSILRSKIWYFVLLLFRTLIHIHLLLFRFPLARSLSASACQCSSSRFFLVYLLSNVHRCVVKLTLLAQMLPKSCLHFIRHYWLLLVSVSVILIHDVIFNRFLSLSLALFRTHPLNPIHIQHGWLLFRISFLSIEIGLSINLPECNCFRAIVYIKDNVSAPNDIQTSNVVVVQWCPAQLDQNETHIYSVSNTDARTHMYNKKFKSNELKQNDMVCIERHNNAISQWKQQHHHHHHRHHHCRPQQENINTYYHHNSKKRRRRRGNEKEPCEDKGKTKNAERHCFIR